ncbi:MAG TPA: hypothetical protein VJU14_10925 [Solirubrobacterales bacterium]|nr:hypothetical protein [Solirubrobacterales bacterium]
MYEGGDDAERRARKRAEQAQARGEGIRAELLAQLRADGPKAAPDLLPRIRTANVSLSEVTFQLDRLVDEGEVVGRQGEDYRLVAGAGA